MRIALDNRAIKFSGIGVYTRNLAEYFRKQGHDVFLYEDGLQVTKASFWQKYVNLFRRLWREQFRLGSWFAKNGIDIYHVSKNTGVPVFSSIPVVVTVHDVIPHVFPDKYLGNVLERIYYKLAIKISLKYSNKIITISQFSKQELIKYYDINPEKIAVTLLAYNTAFRVITDKHKLDTIREQYSLKDSYILAIGGSEYRKNIQRLINVYQKHFENAYKLVVIGGKWRNVDLPNRYQADANIKFLTNIPEEDLVCIYNMAEVFVFPSFYEGFGIPVLEGMACGVPVVTSNVSSMPEVGCDAAVYFNPYDEEDMWKKINKLLCDTVLRREMIQKGLRQVKKFSWDKCMRETLTVYNSILDI